MLLKAGASPEAEEEYGNTPLIIATNFCRGDDPAVIRVLIKYGADVNVRSMFGLVPLLIAAENGLYNVVQYLVGEEKADIHRRGAFGNTALHYAVLNRQDNVATLLHEYGADWTLKNDDGKTPSDLASRKLLQQLNLLDPSEAVVADDDGSEADDETLRAQRVCAEYADDSYFESTILIGNKHLHVPSSELQFNELVGRGNFSEVFSGEFRGERVAVKRLHVSLHGQLRYMDMMKNEISLMAKFSHPNIIKLIGACVIRPHICLVLEWGHRGNLEELLQRGHQRHAQLPSSPSSSLHVSPLGLTSEHLLGLASDVASGMAYAHAQQVYHRDIRASNVLVTEDWTAKICDWGLSFSVHRRTGCQAQSPSHQAIGSLRWMAPEVFRCEGVSEKSDVFSFGMLLFEMLCEGEHPFASVSPREAATLAASGQTPSFPSPTSPTAEHLTEVAQTCLAVAPADRPTFAELCLIFSKFRASQADRPALPRISVSVQAS